jgi:taurine dioxygenase
MLVQRRSGEVPEPSEPDARTLLRPRALEPFGVELDLDLSVDLPAAARAGLRACLARHGVLVARGQRLGLEAQVRLMSWLGPVLRTPDSIGELSPDTPLGLDGAALCFHADYAFTPEPLLGISLHALEVAGPASPTRFASGQRAWRRLDPALRARVQGLRALQVFGARLDRRNRLAELDPALPRSAHPLVWDDPEGGGFLFAPQMTTDSVVGWSPADSEALLAQLFAALYAPDNVREHRWRAGDLVIWDNRRVVHARAGVARAGRRVLQRVTTGTRSMFQLHPELAALYGMSAPEASANAPGASANAPGAST